MILRLLDLYDTLVNFFDAVVTKWAKKDNPFAAFNEKFAELETFYRDTISVFINGN